MKELKNGGILNSCRNEICKKITESEMDLCVDHPRAVHIDYDVLYRIVTEEITYALKIMEGEK